MNIRRRLRSVADTLGSESGENTMTMIIAFPFLMAIIFTIMDFAFYMNDMAMLRSDLRDGARTAAIFGGNGSGTGLSSNLATSYGATCSGVGSGGDVVSCLVKNQIGADHGYISLEVSNVKCDADASTVKIGAPVYCQADYQYDGVPGSAFGMLGPTFSSQAGTHVGTWNKGTVKVSAQSEVAD